MLLYHIVILSLIQGLTEFLPISSSGHLIIIPQFLGWPDQGLAMDVAVHLGTLLAVLAYFRHDIRHMIHGALLLCKGRMVEGGRLALHLCIATIPAVIVGAWIASLNISYLRTFVFVGSTTLVFGIVLWLVDRHKPQTKTIDSLTFSKSLLIGMAQALALMPGTSRSGICMTMGRALDLTRVDAARFSFLLSIPTIIGAAVYTGYKLHVKGLPFITETTLIAIGASFVFGLMAINFMMTWLRKSNFTLFVVYRIILGICLITLGLTH